MPFVNESQIAAFAAWNYTYLYDNGTAYFNETLSNGTQCYMLRPPYMPAIFPNGTVTNSTGCSQPINPMKSHGKTGIAFAALFILLVPFCITALARHGKRAYSAKSKLYPYGKRWEFYWQLFTIIFVMISSFFAIDIDRVVVQSGGFGAYCLFWSAQLPVALAAIWEMSRNWAQVAADTFIADRPEMPLNKHNDSLPIKIQFWMPLLFYAVDFLALFLVSLRPWGGVIRANEAEATDGRFKAGGIFAVLAYLVICWMILNALSFKPARSLHAICVILCMVLVVPRIIYTNLQMYDYDISPFNPNVDVLYTSLLGYLPLLAVLIVMNARGLLMQNIDKTMLQQRQAREKEWQKQFNKTGAGTTIASGSTHGGMLRSDAPAPWLGSGPAKQEHELKQFSYVVERKTSDDFVP